MSLVVTRLLSYNKNTSRLDVAHAASVHLSVNAVLDPVPAQALRVLQEDPIILISRAVHLLPKRETERRGALQKGVEWSPKAPRSHFCASSLRQAQRLLQVTFDQVI